MAVAHTDHRTYDWSNFDRAYVLTITFYGYHWGLFKEYGNLWDTTLWAAFYSYGYDWENDPGKHKGRTLLIEARSTTHAT